LAALCLCVSILISAARSSEEDKLAPPPRATPRASGESSGGPYCGIYSLYAAMRSLGMTVRFEDLARAQYVGSLGGSSLAELQRAASDLGAMARPLQDGTALCLRNSVYPVILHVRRPGFGMPYRHWVLFLGVENDQARIIDPPNEVELVPFAQLMALWDGVGLIVTKESVPLWPMTAVAWIEQASAFLLVAVMAGIVLSRKDYGAIRQGVWYRGLRLASSVALLTILATASAVIWQSATSDGFFHNRRAIGLVAARHFEAPLSVMSLADLESALGRNDVTVIDARLPRSYESGHVPGAVSLPVVAGLAERESVFAGLDPRNQVIVYCQSEGCTWAKAVAADLYFRGCRRVALFPGGWMEWEQRRRPEANP
jgi:rhodanese-related sulfurtransferase